MRMYGCGVRRSETATLRIQHVNVDTGMLSVQFGKGGTSRTVPLPHKIHGAIMRPFEQVRALHQADMQRGYDRVFLPASFAKKAKSAARELVWQWCFPARRLTLEEGAQRRRHACRSRGMEAGRLALHTPDHVRCTKRRECHRPTRATVAEQTADTLQRVGHRGRGARAFLSHVQADLVCYLLRWCLRERHRFCYDSSLA